MTFPRPPSAAAADLFRAAYGHHRAGRRAAAETLYGQAIQADPRHFDALHLLGVLLVECGRAERGVELMRRAIAVRPDSAAVRSNLARTLNDLGRPAEALIHGDRAVALAPTLAAAWVNRAVALEKLGRHLDALESCDRAIALEGAMAEAHNNRGLALRSLDRHEEALASFEIAADLGPRFAEPHFNRGNTLRRLGRLEEALAAFDRALALAPGHADALTDRGLVLRILHRAEAALADTERVVALKPDDPDAHYNRAAALIDLRRWEDAIAAYDRALALRPDHADARQCRGITRLMLGRFEAGWRDYEARKATWGEHLDPARLWLGDGDVAGRRVHITSEQGFGDTLQFCRYVPLLRDRGADVTVAVQAPLRDLLDQIAPGRVLADDAPPPDFDLHCPMMSLPLAFSTRLETIPASPRYLRADPARRARFAAVLGPQSRMRIGLAWSGSPTNTNDRNRSMPFAALAPLLAEDVEWIALQNEIRPADAPAVAAAGVAFHGPRLTDFSQTAALTELMDLVIAVDTSVAHLAGALGKPVWVLLPYIPEWRWLLDRPDSPWHPTARLFRQPAPGDWPSVIRAVHAALRTSPPPRTGG